LIKMANEYLPSPKILRNYAQVLVDFALGTGRGIKRNEVVLLQYDQMAEPLALAVYRRILEKGAHPILRQNEEAFAKEFYERANRQQLSFFPEKYTRALVDTIDHRLFLMAEANPQLLKGVDPQKIMLANKTKKKLRQWLFEKEDQGKLTWTLALYGTAGAAHEAKLTIEEYWEQIIKACYLNTGDPIKEWKKTFVEVEKIVKALNQMPIDKIRVQAKDTDITYTLGAKRAWMGGSGRNIPSFEIFTSPNWRGTNGVISFDQPLYRYGNLVEGIRLEFKNGKVVRATAKKNETLLKELVKQKNADKVGEFSLTDTRFSKIDKFMAHTLYDENFGGQFGNTHLALGSSYHDCYKGDPKKLKPTDWAKLGYNDSVEHTDIIASANRTVTATLLDGTQKVIYIDGHFRA
jgi:aminopeptidase